MHHASVRSPILIPRDGGSVDLLHDGVLAGDDRGIITFIGPHEEFVARHPVAPPPRASDGIIIPPMLDAHIHIPQHPIRGQFVDGVVGDPPEGRLLAGLNRNVFPAEAKCANQEYTRAVVRAFLEDTLSKGVVGGSAYMTVHPSATRIALEMLPEFWHVGMVLMNQHCPEYLRTAEATMESDTRELHAHFGNRVIVTDRFAVAVDSSLRRRAAELARELQLRMQTHLNEQIREKEFVERTLHPDARSYAHVYDQDGLLGRDAMVAHCVHMRDEEWDLLAERGAHVNHCPISNTLLDSGVMNLDALLSRGIDYAICTDVGASPTTSLLVEMSHFVNVHRSRSDRATPTEALYRTTLGAARMLHLDDRVGRLEVGRPMSFLEMRCAPDAIAKDSVDEVIAAALLSSSESIEVAMAQLQGKVTGVTLGGKIVWERVGAVESERGMRDFLVIHVNGKRHEIGGTRAFQTLSDFLRYDLALTGTKVVCSEGDCGSCTVFVGRTTDDARIEYRTVTSCIQNLCQLDCTHVITVEGLTPEGELNAIQESMVRSQGAQCGFCTPGFVVSLQALFEERPATEYHVRAACVGNLCRCTGYEPIIRAAMDTDATKFRRLEQLYPPCEMLGEMSMHMNEPVLVRTAGKAFFKPVNIESALQFKLGNPHCVVIAGGTDLGVLMNKGIREPQTFLSLSAISELRRISREPATLIVGATASLSDFEKACADAIPECARMMHYFGSPPIRNAGTLGGNIANGSPIADTLPALYVLDAHVELSRTGGARRVSINDFFTGYKKNVMQPDELITRVIIPVPTGADLFKLYKISKRKDLDISAFTAAFLIRRADDGKIAEARIAYGGVGPNVIRLRKVEDFLAGSDFVESTFDQAARIALDEITPISDVRGSVDFRFQLSENIMRKFYFDLAEFESTTASAGGNGRIH